jgi:hypothetical protein
MSSVLVSVASLHPTADTSNSHITIQDLSWHLIPFSSISNVPVSYSPEFSRPSFY